MRVRVCVWETQTWAGAGMHCGIWGVLGTAEAQCSPSLWPEVQQHLPLSHWAIPDALRPTPPSPGDRGLTSVPAQRTSAESASASEAR